MAKYRLSIGNSKRAFVFDPDQNPLFKIERIDGGANAFASKGLLATALGLFEPTTTGGSGSGDVSGPGSSTDNAIPRYDGTTGKLLQGSGATIADGGDMVLVGGLTIPLTKKLKIIACSNGCAGGATLASGTVTVATTAVDGTCLILVMPTSQSASAGHLSIGAIVDNTSFVIESSNAADDRDVSWLIVGAV